MIEKPAQSPFAGRQQHKKAKQSSCKVAIKYSKVQASCAANTYTNTKESERTCFTHRSTIADEVHHAVGAAQKLELGYSVPKLLVNSVVFFVATNNEDVTLL
jgi:hypothetical protein